MLRVGAELRSARRPFAFLALLPVTSVSFLSLTYARILSPIALPPSPEPPEPLGELANIGIAISLNCSTEQLAVGLTM